MNRLLLDSHVLLWALAQTGKLSPKARELIEDEQSTLYFSIVSVWEIAVKLSIGRLELPADWLALMQSHLRVWGVRWLDVAPAHCALVATMPFHHKDPFDRMLIAQALAEDLVLLSSDAVADAYGVARVW